MPIHIVRNDITKMRVDAVVNAAKPSLLGGGGVDGAIHRAAGPGLLEECRTLGGCETGQAKITKGYALPSRYVIHTVGPVWRGGNHGEQALLASCYRSSLELAVKYGCESIAFPLISAGIYGYPKDQALRIAMDSIASFLMENEQADDMTVYMVIYSRESFQLGNKIFAGIREYINDNYVSDHRTELDDRRIEQRENKPPIGIPCADKPEGPEAKRPSAGYMQPPKTGKKPFFTSRWGKKTRADSARTDSEIPVQASPEAAVQAAEPTLTEGALDDSVLCCAEFSLNTASLDDRVSHLDESFQQSLLRRIDKSGMTDAQCYKKANIDRKLFSKIRSDVNYRPSKKTALALAVALELDLQDTKDLLMKAGFALSHSNVSDVIIEYFIANSIYDIFVINEALFAYDQVPLGQ